MYALVNYEIDSVKQNTLLDSLISNYGKPTNFRDSTFKISNKIVSSNIRVWSASHTKLELTTRDDSVSILRFMDLKSKRAFFDLSKRIMSRKDKSSEEFNQMEKIGKLKLKNTRKKLLESGKVKIDKSKVTENYTSTTYRIDYDKYLKPFLGIENKKVASNSDDNAIEAEVDFSDERILYKSDNDSLYLVSISFEKTTFDRYRMPFVDYSDLVDVIGNKFGQYSFEEMLYTKVDTTRRSYWLSDDLIIELEDEAPFAGSLQINFYVNELPYSILPFSESIKRGE